MPNFDSGRNARQRELIPPDVLARCHAVVVGVGSIGRQVALQLAAIGIPVMTLVDPETVSEADIGSAGFWETDVGDPKVHAVANVCHSLFERMALHAIFERFRESMVAEWPRDVRHAVFVCTESIELRRLIWDSIRQTAGFVVEGSTDGEAIRLRTSCQPSHDARFTQSPKSGDDILGSQTSQTPIYSACVVAALMVGQFARWLRGLPVNPDRMLDLFAGEFMVVNGK